MTTVTEPKAAKTQKDAATERGDGAKRRLVAERHGDHIGTPSGIELHPHFYDLLNETHARTANGMGAPCLVSHMVFLSDEDSHQRDREAVRRFAEMPRHHIMELEGNHARVQTPQGILKWERHTEFSSYTLFEEDPEEGADSRSLADTLTNGWPIQGAGKLLLALRVHVDGGEEMRWWRDWEKRPTSEPSGCLSRINGGRAIIRTNFMPGADGFSHIYIKDLSGNDRVRGRVTQRILDIETYRILSLLALPAIKSIGPRIAAFDDGIAAVARDLSSDVATNDEEMLGRITSIAADVEELAVSSQFRLNASRAYAGIVESRMADLREEKVDGYQRFTSFIKRRLQPAVRTMEAILERQRQVSARVARISDLLRARVDVALEKQNQSLLASMDERVTQQLKLQKTVEGLSVIAISYYLIGIVVVYFLKPISELVDVPQMKLLTIAAVPLILLFVWTVITRVRKDGDS
ncbi:MAG: DUF3422 domain-containing protein [Pseudomonadota bacterium]